MAVNDNIEDDDLVDDGVSRRLYLARWPDGSATLLSATSLVEVADMLDEIDDPGGCEVTLYDGPVCVHMRPNADPAAGYLDLTEGSFETEDARLGLLHGAFPILHELVVEADTDEESHEVSPSEWSEAVEREAQRELQPSPAWTAALSEWWNQLTTPRDE